MNPPVCQHLRTKIMFIPALAAEASATSNPQVDPGPCHYWCNCTLTEVGPDDQAAHPQVCLPQRSCFEVCTDGHNRAP